MRNEKRVKKRRTGGGGGGGRKGSATRSKRRAARVRRHARVDRSDAGLPRARSLVSCAATVESGGFLHAEANQPPGKRTSDDGERARRSRDNTRIRAGFSAHLSCAARRGHPRFLRGPSTSPASCGSRSRGRSERTSRPYSSAHYANQRLIARALPCLAQAPQVPHRTASLCARGDRRRVGLDLAAPTCANASASPRGFAPAHKSESVQRYTHVFPSD